MHWVCGPLAHVTWVWIGARDLVLTMLVCSYVVHVSPVLPWKGARNGRSSVCSDGAMVLLVLLSGPLCLFFVPLCVLWWNC